MQSLNKKGVAETLTTLVLVVIALASVTLAGYSILNLVRAGNIQASPTFNCLQLQTQFPPAIKLARACYNSQTNKLEALVQRNSLETNILSLSFTMDAETWTCSKETCNNCVILESGTSQVYYLKPDKTPIGKNLEIYIGSCKIDDIKINNC